MAEIFISHSSRDEDIKNFFSRIFASTPVKANFVEFEPYPRPPSAYIQERINASKALFVLLGPHVRELAHTQTWIAWETGIARGLVPQARKDVWVFEPLDVWCEVPIPYVDHYVIYDQSHDAFNYIKCIIMSYDDSGVLPAMLLGAGLGGVIGAGIGAGATGQEERERRGEGAAPGVAFGAIAGAILSTLISDPTRNRPVGVSITCPNEHCKASFRVHTTLETFPCPTCREWMQVRWSHPRLREYTNSELQQFLEEDKID